MSHFEKLKSECVEESLKKGEDTTPLLTKRVLKDFILFSSTKRRGRALPQKDFNNGSKSECFTFTTENTPKKPRTQRSPKPDTNANGETPVLLSSLKLMEISSMVLSLNVSQQKTIPRTLGLSVWLHLNPILTPMVKLQLFYQSLKLWLKGKCL